jgi:hypothetical protein
VRKHSFWGTHTEQIVYFGSLLPRNPCPLHAGIDGQMPCTRAALPFGDGLAIAERRRQACCASGRELTRQERRADENAPRDARIAQLGTLFDRRNPEAPRA